MSSLHTVSERALAEIGISQVAGDRLAVLIGGLGLGYTAAAALENRRVGSVEVVEYLPQVIEWLTAEMFPMAKELNQDQRLTVTAGDVYSRLTGPAADGRCYDAILIDVDHSPEDNLTTGNAAFYSLSGLRGASRHLRPGGVLAFWSYAEATPVQAVMAEVFSDVEVHRIDYWNQHVGETVTDWLYSGRRPVAPAPVAR